MTCKTCGEQMNGDGATSVLICPNTKNIDKAAVEPDAPAIYCSSNICSKCGLPFKPISRGIMCGACYKKTFDWHEN